MYVCMGPLDVTRMLPIAPLAARERRVSLCWQSYICVSTDIVCRLYMSKFGILPNSGIKVMMVGDDGWMDCYEVDDWPDLMPARAKWSRAFKAYHDYSGSVLVCFPVGFLVGL